MGKLVSKTGLLALTCAFVFAPSLACAAGLGKLSVSSALGEPLRAEIEIVSLRQGEGETLSAKLANAEAFRQANIELNGVLLTVKFAVERRAEGQYVVTLKSTQPVNEPFIDMLVELGWSSGRLVREYTFLLDPIEYKGQAGAPTAVQAAPAAPVAPPKVEALPATEEPKAEQAAPAVAAPAEAAPALKAAPAPLKSTGTYEVKRGDTLAKIATQNRIEGVSFQQMLVALLRANRDAFVADNMNRLRAGKILNIPDKDAAASVDLADARRIVAAQSADFAEYRRSIGAAVAAAPARPAGGRQASGRIGAPAEEKPVPAKEPAKDQLRLSRADDAARGGKAAASAVADDLAAKNKALKEAGERVAALEKNVQELQKLAELKSGAGAQLQQQAQAGKAAPAEAPKAAEPAKAADAPKAEAAKAPEAAKAEPAKAPEAAPKAAEAAKAEAPKAAPAKAAAKAPAQSEPSFVEELLENIYMLIAVAVAVLGLIGYAVFKWRRKRGSQRFDDGVASSPSGANSVLGAEGGRNIDTGSSSMQSDFSQSGIGKIDTEEIDPIAEADVYMAYGRDTQAEEILKEALTKDSSRHNIRAKLLEIYANRKDRNAFGATAGELQAATGGQGPEWEKAVSLGLSIDPENPLYGGTPTAAAAGSPLADTQVIEAAAPTAVTQPGIEPGAPLDIDFALDTGATAATQPDINLDVTTQAEAAPAGGLDFDLGLGGDKPAEQAAGTLSMSAPAAPEAAPAAAGGGLDIDFDLPSIGAPEQPAPAPAPAASSGGIDFDLGLPGAGSAAPAGTPKVADMDLSAISLDLGEPGGGSGATPDPHWQEVATKLDLAKEYELMGNKDDARELLKEVVKEGDAAQQQQAQAMLQALG